MINHNGDTTLWSAPLLRGVWHDFVVHVYFSATKGYIEFWYDGVQALPKIEHDGSWHTIH